MTLGFLTRMLVKEENVVIKDKESHKVYATGKAGDFTDRPDDVKGWDFSREHCRVIYV